MESRSPAPAKLPPSHQKWGSGDSALALSLNRAVQPSVRLTVVSRVTMAALRLAGRQGIGSHPPTLSGELRTCFCLGSARPSP
jgi:hypothetical protein